MGQFIEVEQDSAIGRVDAIIVTADTVFAFNFSLPLGEGRGGAATAEDAIKQIENKGYLTPYIASNIYPDGGRKNLVKIGAEFSKTERGLKRWVIV